MGSSKLLQRKIPSTLDLQCSQNLVQKWSTDIPDLQEGQGISRSLKDGGEAPDLYEEVRTPRSTGGAGIIHIYRRDKKLEWELAFPL